MWCFCACADDEVAQFLSVDVLAEPMLDFAAPAPVPSSESLHGEAARRRIRFSPEPVGEMGAERRIHRQSLFPSSLEDARSGASRVQRVPVASMRAAGGRAEHAMGRDQSERGSTQDATVRAAQHEVQTTRVLPSVDPDIALKASTGSLLGLSQAASGDVLALGFGGSALVSADVDLGGYFYEHQAGMAEVPVDGGGTYPLAVASDEMACFSTPGSLVTQLDCSVMDPEARRVQRAWFALSAAQKLSTPQPQATIWSRVEPRQTLPSRSACPWKAGNGAAGVCVGEAASAWKKAAAVMATSPGGMRYVRTLFAVKNVGNGQHSWVCTSGCADGSGSPWDQPNMTSSDSTYGRALALHGNLLAVGTPGVRGDGFVQVYAAKGTVGPSGYGHHTWWEIAHSFPPPPDLGTGQFEYTGAGNFGAALSLSSKWLVIGAPGNSSVAALIRVYKVSGTSLSHFCEVKHPDATVDSQFGSSIAQSSHDTYPWTIVLVGAPGENVAYSVLLRDDPPLCKMHEVFEPPANDKDSTDRFGFSVALSRQFVFIGTPFYLRWYKDASGLLYSSSFCFPGSRWQEAGVNALPFCQICPRDKTSDGGTASVCKDCLTASGDPIAIPEQSTLDYGCSYTCDTAYFGSSCIRCSEYALTQGWSKPEFSEWVDGDPKCFARCIGGYYQMEGGNNRTFECGKCSATPIFESRSNVQWIVGSCEWKCIDTYFADADNYCWLCSRLKANDGISPPDNAEYVDGLTECEWAPKLGYNCTYDAVHNPTGQCIDCQNKPLNSQFAIDAGADPLSREKCNYECNDGFFGHPTYPGVCEECETLQTQYAKVLLPANAVWDTSPSTCTADSWTCRSGFNASTSMRYCCPDSIPNSYPLQSYQPCGRACNPGYFWDDDTATCEECDVGNPPKQNHEWLLDCDFKCTCSTQPGGKCYYGRQELENCYSCDVFQNMLGNSPPYNGYWYQDPPISSDEDLPVCDEMAWGCNTGSTKSLSANPPGCCPDSLPYSSVVVAAGEDFRDTCNFACVDGYMWDSDKKNCTQHRNPEDKIANSVWNYRTGVWECLDGFVALPLGQTPAQRCMECSVYALREEWILPQGARWLNASELDGETCTDTAFECVTDNYIPNTNARLCCPPDNLPAAVLTDSHLNGEWDSTKCEYRCVAGKFPINPTQNDPVCRECSRYLIHHNVPSERPCNDNDEYKWCEGIDWYGVPPTSCTASITINLFISGIPLQNFTRNSAVAGSVVDVLLTALSDLLGVDRSHVGLAYVSEVQANRNVEAGRRLLQVLGSRLRVGALMRNLNPVTAVAGKNTLESSAATSVFNALDRAGYDARVERDGVPVLGPSSEVWACKIGFALNHATGRCCAKQYYQDPSGIDTSRYFWHEDGCKYSCVDSFRGADCLSCSEFNKDKFKPDNAIWDDSSPDCTTWKCRTGYIRSVTGFSCQSLKQLEDLCSSNARCATCVAQGNCVWCSGRCVPGQSNGTNAGCPYINQVASPDCRCEARTCSQECLYDSCSKCIKDAYCGWCAGTERCMLGSYYSPQAQLCPQGWSAGTYTQCHSEQSIWMVGIISASVSILLVLLMCLHFILRVRAAARNRQRPQLVAFGAAPAAGTTTDEVMHADTRAFGRSRALIFTMCTEGCQHARCFVLRVPELQNGRCRST